MTPISLDSTNIIFDGTNRVIWRKFNFWSHYKVQLVPVPTKF